MERNCQKVTYSVRYGSGFPHSLPSKGKFMDQDEPRAVPPLPPGLVTDTKSKYEDCKETEASNSLSPVRFVRKRKGYHDMDVHAFDTTMFDWKRMRQNNTRASRSKEAVKPRRRESFNLDIGGEEIKLGCSKRMPSSGCPRAPFHFYDGPMQTERLLHPGSEPSETSIASSDDAGDDKRSGGNTSTLTSNEEGDSKVMSSQMPKVVVPSSNRLVRYAVPSKDDSFTGIVRQDVLGPRHLPSSGDQSPRWKLTRKSLDGEVISGQRKKTLSSYAARDCELNRVFGVGLWESQNEKGVDGRRKASTLDSAGSNEAGKSTSRDSKDIGLDIRWSKLKQASNKYGPSNSSREHQSSSSVTDLCASSDSVSLWLEGANSVKPYHRFRSGVLGNMASNTRLPDLGHIISNTRLDDKATAAALTEKAVHPTSVQDEQRTTSRSQYTSSRSEGTHPATILADREAVAPPRDIPIGREAVAPTRDISSGHDDSSSGSGSGGSESSKPAPTFVLSSGRMSKSQEAQLGKRPTTIDDDFDQYFAQLML